MCVCACYSVIVCVCVCVCVCVSVSVSVSVSVCGGKNTKTRPLSSVSPAATTLSRPSHYWPERDKHGVKEITIGLHTHTHMAGRPSLFRRFLCLSQPFLSLFGPGFCLSQPLFCLSQPGQPFAKPIAENPSIFLYSPGPRIQRRPS